MEIITYGTLYFITLIAALLQIGRYKSRPFLFWYLIILLALIVVIRQAYDSDIRIYATAMQTISTSFYYAREPVVWIGQAYLYRALKSDFLVFLVYDFVAIILVFRSLRNLAAPSYVYFGIFLFFPFILGMQNVYRQWYASILFLWAFSLIVMQRQAKFHFSKTLKPLAVAILAFLAHNMAGVFMPLLFYKRRNVLEGILLVISVPLAIIAMYLGMGSKSEAQTGVDIGFVYLLVYVAIFLAFFAMDNLKIRLSKQGEEWYSLWLVSFVIASFSAYLLSPAGAERMAMFGLTILFPLLAVKAEKTLTQKQAFRAIYITLGFVPIFMFGTRDFVLR